MMKRKHMYDLNRWQQSQLCNLQSEGQEMMHLSPVDQLHMQEYLLLNQTRVQ
jgi:hypothetical protein